MESATETYRSVLQSKGEMVRQELTSNQATGWLDKPHLEQDRIEGRLKRSAEALGLVA
jgi:hypothetical protein